MKRGLVTLVVIMILKDSATFQVLYIVSFFGTWNITTVVINGDVHLLKLNPPSAFVYFRWSWSWSCYFGLLSLKNLVLFTSLLINSVFFVIVSSNFRCSLLYCCTCHLPMSLLSVTVNYMYIRGLIVLPFNNMNDNFSRKSQNFPTQCILHPR